MHALVAPDKFKGTLSAREAAEAIAAGVRIAWPSSELTLLPLADGGEGTSLALLGGKGGRTIECRVEGPLSDLVTASITSLDDGSVVVEMSEASGLRSVARRKEPLRASSLGTGRLIARATEVRRDGPVIVGVGGSASTDGGTGAATAIGWRFLDERGRDLTPGGGALVDLHSIVRPEALPSNVLGACDVSAPLTGDRGAARVFSPQKGATLDDVERLEAGLIRLREVVERELGLDLNGVPGAGAGGGMGGGLVAFFDAPLRSGFDVVADAVGLDDALTGATVVITGEGRLDRSSLVEKVPGGVLVRARRAGVPCLVVAGEIAVDDEEVASAGFGAAVRAPSRDGSDPIDAASRVTEATATMLESFSDQP